MKRRSALLILLAVLTLIPTGIFVVVLSVFLPFVLRNLGGISIHQYGDRLEFVSDRETFSAPISFTLVLVLSTVVFSVSAILLFRSWLIGRNRKQKMRESYTA